MLGRGDDEDGDGALGHGDVAVDDLVDDFAEHQRDEEVEGGEVADGPLAEDADHDEHQDVDEESTRGGHPELLPVHEDEPSKWSAR